MKRLYFYPKYSIYFILFWFNSFLYGQNSSSGCGIYEIDYAAPLYYKGLYATFEYNNLKEYSRTTDKDSLTSKFHYLFKISYGLNDQFDILFKLPYGGYYKAKEELTGFKDTYFALKFNKDLDYDYFNLAFKFGLSLPTGKSKGSKIITERLTLFKKGYDLSCLLDYDRADFSFHLNFGYFTQDNFKVVSDVNVMNFNYSFGLTYRVLSYSSFKLWLKWEFYTAHSLDKDFNDIKGSQYFGLYSSITDNLTLHAGYVHELYDSRFKGYQVGLNYTLSGVKAKKSLKLFDKYNKTPLKIGFIELDNDNDLQADKSLSSEIDDFLKRVNQYDVTMYDFEQKDIDYHDNQKKMIAKMQKDSVVLAIYGEILSQGFINDTSFKIPLLIKREMVSYEIMGRILVFDLAKKVLIYNEIITGKGCINKDYKFLDILDKKNLEFPTSLEEIRLKREAREDFSRRLLEQLSGIKIK